MLPLMQTSTAFAPSPSSGPQSDNFAAFLARLAELPDWDSEPAVEPSGTYPSPEPAEAGEEDLASLSYEHALRTPTPKASRKENLQPRKPSPQTALAGAPPMAQSYRAMGGLSNQPSPPSLEISRAFQIAEPRHARTTIRFTAGENKLLRKRAAESNIAISAYVRSCVLEVESLRAQVRQLMTELRPSAASQSTYSVAEPQAPTLNAPPPQPSLPAPEPPRPPMQPLTARTPQPPSTLRLDPRIQAAFDAQKRLSAQHSAPAIPEKKRSSLFSFLLGNRRSA
jgi:hypothetical protein